MPAAVIILRTEGYILAVQRPLKLIYKPNTHPYVLYTRMVASPIHCNTHIFSKEDHNAFEAIQRFMLCSVNGSNKASLDIAAYDDVTPSQISKSRYDRVNTWCISYGI